MRSFPDSLIGGWPNRALTRHGMPHPWQLAKQQIAAPGRGKPSQASIAAEGDEVEKSVAVTAVEAGHAARLRSSAAACLRSEHRFPQPEFPRPFDCAQGQALRKPGRPGSSLSCGSVGKRKAGPPGPVSREKACSTVLRACAQLGSIREVRAYQNQHRHFLSRS